MTVDKNKLYSVSELAQEFNLTAQGLRFYEEKGLLHPARSGRARVYAYRDRARLGLIQRLRHLGFSIDDIAEYLALYRPGPGGAEQYRRGVEQTEKRIAALLRMREEIDQTVAELERLKQEATARLEEALAQEESAAGS